MREPAEEGQGLLEYGIIIVLVAVIVSAMVLIFGSSVGNLFSNVVSNF